MLSVCENDNEDLLNRVEQKLVLGVELCDVSLGLCHEFQLMLILTIK